MHDTERNLGAVIRARRLARGMTLVEVGHLARLDYSTLSKVERGLARIPVPTYDRIAIALGWTPARLFGAATGRRAA